MVIDSNLGPYWKTVFDTMADGVIVVDGNCTIVAANRALEEITGYDKRALAGQPCTILDCDLCFPDRKGAGGRGKRVCELFKSGKVVRRRCRLRRRDGSTLHVLKNAAILKNSEGKTVGGVETLTDITDLVEKEEVIKELKHLLSPEESFEGIIGKSQKMLEAYDLIRNAAASDVPIIIYGESGTGKELAANAIHRLSKRSKRALVKVNCAALNESLLESELFGHVKGAFTGAGRNRKGRFEAAHRGVLFLDEIGDMSLAIQVKLLRVLQEKVIERVGEQTPVPVDMRVIAATHRDLKEMCREGKFREDLFYRLNVIPILLPPLRERPEDIPLLVDHFIRTIGMKTEKNMKGVTGEAMEMMVSYRWPGNVRELINVLEYAFVVCREELIAPQHLPSLNFETHIHYHRSKKNIAKLTGREELVRILESTGGNRQEASRLLGISRVTLWKLLKEQGITVEPIIKSIGR